MAAVSVTQKIWVKILLSFLKRGFLLIKQQFSKVLQCFSSFFFPKKNDLSKLFFFACGSKINMFSDKSFFQKSLQHSINNPICWLILHVFFLLLLLLGGGGLRRLGREKK